MSQYFTKDLVWGPLNYGTESLHYLPLFKAPSGFVPSLSMALSVSHRCVSSFGSSKPIQKLHHHCLQHVDPWCTILILYILFTTIVPPYVVVNDRIHSYLNLPLQWPERWYLTGLVHLHRIFFLDHIPPPLPLSLVSDTTVLIVCVAMLYIVDDP